LITSKFDIEESKNRAELIKKELERNEQELKESKEQIDATNHELSELRLRRYKLDDANTQIGIDLKEKLHILKDLSENIESIGSILSDKVESSEDAQVISELYEAQAKRNDLISNQKQLRSERLDLTIERDGIESELRAATQNVNACLRQIAQEENNFSRADANLENLLDTLNEEYEMTYEHAYENYELTMDLVEARSRVKRLKSEIRRIGAVNLDAREEYLEKKDRFDFLTTQRDDLKESKENLMNTITEMDDVMVTKFSDTFEAIRTEYSKNFKKLFAGGSADLVLTNKDNLLETGIDIIAEPPGKKLSHLSLLSGGEKSLATLALFFAILRVRPVPFVILDEAEAALDEANLVRFSGFLNEFSKSTQFIVITHRKTTMEHTQSLYGVTMQESGVTKLVSVRFGDLEKFSDEDQEMSEA
jgi:chromosome segregation protein